MGLHLVLVCGGKNNNRKTLPAVGKGMHRIKEQAQKKKIFWEPQPKPDAENLKPGRSTQRVSMFYRDKYHKQLFWGRTDGNHYPKQCQIP